VAPLPRIRRTDNRGWEHPTPRFSIFWRLRPEDHVVAVDDLGEVAVGGEVVGAAAADGGELRRGVVGQAPADGGAGGGHEGDEVARVEGAGDGGDPHGQEAAALGEEGAAGAVSGGLAQSAPHLGFAIAGQPVALDEPLLQIMPAE
jgi:hypothetical protein